MNFPSGIPKSILVRASNWIGDQVLAYPFFYFLRRAYPQARIVSACSSWVEAVQFRTLVDEVVVLPRILKKGWMARLENVEASARLLKAHGPWDLAISLPNSLTAAWQIFRAGARVRRGYAVEGRGLLLNQRESWQQGAQLHRADAYVKLLPPEARPSRSAVEFWGISPENELDPGVPGVIPNFDAQKEWPSKVMVEPPAEDYWVLAPGSTAESRRWPLERFATLARRISDVTGLTGVVVGGVAEAVLAEKLCQERSRNGVRLLDRTAQGPVNALWNLFRSARFTVANDSGLAHVAALCGSPVQVIWGAGDPRRTRPLGPGKVQVSLNAINCWPCERNVCEQAVDKRLECLGGITTEGVWAEIEKGILRPSFSSGGAP